MTGQRGLAAAAIVIVILLLAVTVLFARRQSDESAPLEQQGVTTERLAALSAAMIAFAKLNERLPCPADGAVNTGLEVRNGGGCTFNDGTVPWTTLGLTHASAVDGWGRKISYRVYSDATRGFTRNRGMSATDCNRDASILATGTAVDDCATLPTHTTHQSDFLLNKGLAVVENGAAVNGVAFVLISHGPSGRGGFTSQGSDASASNRLLPLPSGPGDENANVQAAGTYYTKNRFIPSGSSDPAGETAHFDDLATYVRAESVISAAGLGARIWPVPPPPPPPPSTLVSTTLNAAALETALGVAPGSLNPSVDARTFQNDIDFGSFRVRAFGSSGRYVSFGQGASGSGIGAIGTGTPLNTNATINEATSESLRFQFDTPGRYLGITLIDFGTQSGDPERVRFTFNVGGSSIQITKTACRSGDVLANFTLNPGGDFDEVFVEARSTSGGVDSSRFLIKALATCPSTNSACEAPSAAAGDNCP